jgi:hypothetical protein
VDFCALLKKRKKKKQSCFLRSAFIGSKNKKQNKQTKNSFTLSRTDKRSTAVHSLSHTYTHSHTHTPSRLFRRWELGREAHACRKGANGQRYRFLFFFSVFILCLVCFICCSSVCFLFLSPRFSPFFFFLVYIPSFASLCKL